jgi:RNA polymerase sigma factor (sigma-70 family)
MSGTVVSLLLQHVRRLAATTAPDDRLLTDYIDRHDEPAFAALVGRHGPMVLNLGRRILRDAQAAEDVFQQTFLVLARRAAAIRRRGALASWLHGVAYRLAVRAKRQRASRAGTAGDLAAQPSAAAGPSEVLAWQEMLAILDEELRRLSERYRAPLVYCYLEGRTQDEAARLLGWSPGTLRRRLEQGRKLLQARLSRRGVALSAALGGLLAGGTAAVPPALQAAAVAAALPLRLLRQGGLMVLSVSVKKLVVLGVFGLALGLCALNPGAARQGHESAAAAPPAPAAPAREGMPDADPVFRLAAEAVEACRPNAMLLLELAVLEARRGNAAGARQRFGQAADLLATAEGYPRAMAMVQMAYRLADAGDRASASTLLAEARRLAGKIAPENTRKEILRFAAVCEGEKIDPRKAVASALEIPDEICRLNALKDIAAARAAADDVADARRTVDLIRSSDAYFQLRLREKPWQAIAAARLRAGDRPAAEAALREALAVVEETKRRYKASDWLGEWVDILVDYAVAQGRAGDRAGARANLERVEKELAGGQRIGRSQLYLLANLARGQAEVGERAAALRTMERVLRLAEQEEEPPAVILSPLLALGDNERAAKAVRQIANPEPLRQVCAAMARAGKREMAVALAREAKSAEARAWGLLGAAQGLVDRIPPEHRPRYAAGTFSLTVPSRPAAPEPTRPAAAPDPTSPMRQRGNPRQEMQAAIAKWEQEWEQFNGRFKQAKSEEECRRLLAGEEPSALEVVAGRPRGGRQRPGPDRAGLERLGLANRVRPRSPWNDPLSRRHRQRPGRRRGRLAEGGKTGAVNRP